MSSVHFTAVTNYTQNETKWNWQLTKTNYGIKLINTSHKFVKVVRWKYGIGYNCSYANLNQTQPTQNFKKAHPTQPNTTHGSTQPT